MKKLPIKDEEIILCYERLKSPLKVAKHFGIGASTVERRLQKHGVVRDGQRGLPRKLPSSIVEEYEAGASMNQLARKYDVCLATVAEALRRAGVDSRRRGGMRKAMTDEFQRRAVELYGKLGKQELVARELSTSQTRVSRALIAAGHDTGWMRGSTHRAWKGGTIRLVAGYKMVSLTRDDPMFVMAHKSTGYVMEHRLEMARSIGRPLERHETVHHINGDRADNRVKNLQLRNGHHGSGVVHRCRDCGSTNIESARLQ